MLDIADPGEGAALGQGLLHKMGERKPLLVACVLKFINEHMASVITKQKERFRNWQIAFKNGADETGNHQRVQKAACVFTTARMEADYVSNLGITTRKAIIPNGIETDAYPCKTSVDVVKKQVLFLSRLHIKKGIEILFDAWKRIHLDYSDWQLLVVGNG